MKTGQHYLHSWDSTPTKVGKRGPGTSGVAQGPGRRRACVCERALRFGEKVHGLILRPSPEPLAGPVRPCLWTLFLWRCWDCEGSFLNMNRKFSS